MPDKIKARGADDEAVEILGIALRFLHALSAAGGAASPIRIFRRFAVIGFDDLFGKHRGFVNREIGEVLQLAQSVGFSGVT